jgi:GABA(A) receptor-associated protein
MAAAVVERRPFRLEYSLEHRKDVSGRIRRQYPDRIPVIVERAKDSDAPLLAKNKYLVPSDVTLGRLIFEVRQHLRIGSERAIFLYVNDNLLPSTQTLVSTLYTTQKDADGFLYVQYAGENTFG